MRTNTCGILYNIMPFGLLRKIILIIKIVCTTDEFKGWKLIWGYTKNVRLAAGRDSYFSVRIPG